MAEEQAWHFTKEFTKLLELQAHEPLTSANPAVESQAVQTVVEVQEVHPGIVAEHRSQLEPTSTCEGVQTQVLPTGINSNPEAVLQAEQVPLVQLVQPLN